MDNKVKLIYKPEETFSKPFSIDRHKKTFIDYLEAVIDVNGIVHYAVPSHEKILCKIICEKKGLTNNKLNELAEASGGLYDWINWLMDESECICVYTQGYAYPRYVIPSQEQKKMLSELIKAGLIKNKRFTI